MTQCLSRSEGSLSLFFYLTPVFWKFNFYSVSYELQLSRAFSYYSTVTADTGSLFPRQLQVYCVKRFHFQSDMAHCYQKKNVGFPGSLVVNNLPANIRNMGSIPDPRRSHMPQSNSAFALQPLSLCLKAQEPQLLKPKSSKAHAPQQEEPPQWETCVPHLESCPCYRQQRPSTATKKK